MSFSAPPSPAGKGRREKEGVLEVELDHLQYQIGVLKIELECRDRKVQALVAAETRAQLAEEKLRSARASNRDLAVQIATTLEKFHTAKERAVRMQQSVENLEARIWQYEVQMAEMRAASKKASQKTSLLPPSGTPPPLRENSFGTAAVKDNQVSSSKFLESLGEQEQLPPVSPEPSFSSADGLVVPLPEWQSSVIEIELLPEQPSAAVAAPIPPHSRRPAAPARRYPTYGSSSGFRDIRDEYRRILEEQRSSEDQIVRWSRHVMSNASAVETDPKKVEQVVEGLRELCEENGVPLPLLRVGPNSYRIGENGAKLGVKLINGRLMARSGPSYIDIFQWLERQPLAPTVTSPNPS